MKSIQSPIVVFGANGQVGSALAAQLGRNTLVFSRKDADFSQPGSIKKLLESLETPPSAIINAVAYTAVDKAETEEELAFTINATSPEVIATYCNKNSIPFIHYSTDYVFDGSGTAPRTEDSSTAPLNAYGRTKLAGEEKITAIGGQYLILRTSWVYDAIGKNFFNTMLRLGQERDSLSVVGDQIGTPSYAPHIAECTLAILDNILELNNFPYGIYHLCGTGKTSWHSFAKTIFTLAQAEGLALKITDVKAILTSDYPTPAQRPLNSRLDCSKTTRNFGVTMPHWKESLQDAIEQKMLKEHAA